MKIGQRIGSLLEGKAPGHDGRNFPGLDQLQPARPKATLYVNAFGFLLGTTGLLIERVLPATHPRRWMFAHLVEQKKLSDKDLDRMRDLLKKPAKRR
jgi:hypothetical protein